MLDYTWIHTSPSPAHLEAHIVWPGAEVPYLTMVWVPQVVLMLYALGQSAGRCRREGWKHTSSTSHQSSIFGGLWLPITKRKPEKYVWGIFWYHWCRVEVGMGGVDLDCMVAASAWHFGQVWCLGVVAVKKTDIWGGPLARATVRAESWAGIENLSRCTWTCTEYLDYGSPNPWVTQTHALPYSLPLALSNVHWIVENRWVLMKLWDECWSAILNYGFCPWILQIAVSTHKTTHFTSGVG